MGAGGEAGPATLHAPAGGVREVQPSTARGFMSESSKEAWAGVGFQVGSMCKDGEGRNLKD